MNTNIIIISALVIGVIGLLVGIGLGVFGEKFKVEVDPKETNIRSNLPGNNCGACGYPGCDALAHAIFTREAPANRCPVGGPPVAEKISSILGVEFIASERNVAFIKCDGVCQKANKKAFYYGIHDCLMALNVPGGGDKLCDFGCLGFGSCTKVCPEKAIKLDNGMAAINVFECIGCGKCVNVCPKHIIELVPVTATHIVKCSSLDKGVFVRKACENGCLGCGLCEKNCPCDAIHVNNNLAKIDYSKCSGCGICAEKCPTKAIYIKIDNLQQS